MSRFMNEIFHLTPPPTKMEQKMGCQQGIVISGRFLNKQITQSEIVNTENNNFANSVSREENSNSDYAKCCPHGLFKR